MVFYLDYHDYINSVSNVRAQEQLWWILFNLYIYISNQWEVISFHVIYLPIASLASSLMYNSGPSLTSNSLFLNSFNWPRKLFYPVPRALSLSGCLIAVYFRSNGSSVLNLGQIDRDQRHGKEKEVNTYTQNLHTEFRNNI